MARYFRRLYSYVEFRNSTETNAARSVAGVRVGDGSVEFSGEETHTADRYMSRVR